MPAGRDPLRAIQLIHDLRLHDSIFAIPPSISSTFSSIPAPFSVSLAAATILHLVLHPTLPTSATADPPTLPRIHPTLQSSIDALRTARLYLAAALTSFRGITYTDSKGKTYPAVEASIREGLKLGTQNHYLDGIPPLFSATELIKSPREHRYAGRPERVAIGSCRRRRQVHLLS